MIHLLQLLLLLSPTSILSLVIDPCSLNGDFLNGKCECDPGWKGTNCTSLKLTLANRATPGYYNKSLPTWSGGNIYYADNQYHLFVTSKAYENSSDDLYLCNSKIIHLVSDKAINGPFYYKNTILSNMNLNPFTLYFNDTYFIFDEAYNDVPSVQECNDHFHPNTHDITYNISNVTTQITYSSNINANVQEWMNNQRIIIDPFPGTLNRSKWNCNIQNPTCYIYPNGTTIMVYRAMPCDYNQQQNPASVIHIGVAIAPHWNGPYKTLNNDEPIFGWNVHNEDPYLWRNKRGFHLLMHSFRPPNFSNAGGYAYSIDGISWTLSPYNPWLNWTLWDDGANQTWIRRQKPGLIFDNENNPIYLINGVDSQSGAGYLWNTGWTLFQPISH
eukprot:436115_1